MENEVIKEYKKGNKVLRIYRDDYDESPREWSNLGVMVCFHKRYNLGDETEIKKDWFSSWEEMENYLWKKEKAVVVKDLWLLDHSGLYMKIGDFSHEPLPQGYAYFDSGQVGFIYTTKERIKKWFGVKRVTKKLIEKAEKILEGEVETYNQHLQGDVYRFELVKQKKCKCCGHIEEEIIDSVGGYYGTNFEENGLFEGAGIDDISEWEESE